MRKKPLRFIITFLLGTILLFGCGTSDKDKFYSTLRDFIKLDTNAYQIEIDNLSQETPNYSKYLTDYAYLFQDKEGNYVMKFKIEGVIDKQDNSITSANIYYQIGNMEEYKVLTDIVLEGSVLYINESKLATVIGDLVPEYKVTLDAMSVEETKYMTYDISPTIQQYNEKYNITNQQVSDLGDLVNVLPVAGEEMVSLFEEALKEIDSSVYSQDDEGYTLQVQDTNNETAFNGVMKQLENEGLDKLSTTLEEKKAKLLNENTILKVNVHTNEENSGELKYSLDSDKNDFSITTELSNKEESTIEVPQDTEELSELLIRINGAMYLNSSIQ